jgi:DNA-binding MarR family transcriptional regulator
VERWLLDEDNIARLLRRSAVCIASQVDLRLQPHGLTHAQWLPLLLLQYKQASTSAELASILQIDQGAMTRTLDRLEAKGFCRRSRSLDDRRVVNLELTAEGQRALDHAPELMSGMNASLLQGFSSHEVDLLRTFLRRILSNGASPSPLRATKGRQAAERARSRAAVSSPI